MSTKIKTPEGWKDVAGGGLPLPDWADAVEITAAQAIAGYAAPDDGIIVGYIRSFNGGARVTINSVTVAGADSGANTYFDSLSIQCPVCANDVAKIAVPSGSGVIIILSFVPWKSR